MFPALGTVVGLLHPVAWEALRRKLKFKTFTNTLNDFFNNSGNFWVPPRMYREVKQNIRNTPCRIPRLSSCKFSSILIRSPDYYYCTSKLFWSPLIHNSHRAGLQLVTFRIRLLSQVAIFNTSYVLWTREKTGITLQPRLALSRHILWYSSQRQYSIGIHDCDLDCKATTWKISCEKNKDVSSLFIYAYTCKQTFASFHIV
jgi:hypothetical protein